MHLHRPVLVLSARRPLARALLAAAFCVSIAPAVNAQSAMDLLRRAADAAAGKSPAPTAAPAEPGARPAAAPVSPGVPGAASSADEDGLQDPTVRLALTRARPASWADAQAKAITSVADGDPLWLTIKTEKPLRAYAYKNLDDPDSVAELQLMISTKGSYKSVSQRFPGDSSNWPLKPEEMDKTEISISLAPAAARWFMPPGARFNKSNQVGFFLRFVGGPDAGRGVWENEIYVVGNKQQLDFNGKKTGNITLVGMAVTPITVNVPDGIAKYRALQGENCEPGPKSSRPCRVNQ